MATFQRKIGGRAVRHAVVKSKEHKEDVARNNERRAMYWVGIKQSLEDGHHVIPALGDGIYWVRDKGSGAMLEVDGDTLIKRLDAWTEECSWYYREIEDRRNPRQVVKRWKKTRTSGVQGVAVTCSPWWSNLLYESAQSGEADRVLELSRQAAGELQEGFESQTGRRVLSIQCHYDTVNLHWHLFSTRIGPDHKFIKGTSKRIGLSGPWAVGVMRQVEVGALPEGSTNAEVASRMVERDRARYGGHSTDYRLARLVDGLCYAFFGTSPRLTYWVRLYRQGLRGAACERLEQLRDATTRELGIIRRSGDFEPGGIGFRPAEGGLPGQEVVFQG
jgi:hypothetical protein